MKKTNFNKGTFTILTTDDSGFTYEDYLAFCEDNDIKPGKKDSDLFYEWCRDEANANYDADLDNIKCCKQYQVPVIITGSCGLWDGRHTIVPVIEQSVYNAIQRCFGDSINDINVQFSDGSILVDAYHHDGCNSFTIRALSAKGQKKYHWLGECYDYNDNPSDTKRLPYLYAIGI